jgi:antitoxin (DNA-binding transcriptional repressor) of toxin-antitoxin stability system
MIREKTITATEFKARCLKILERLDPAGIVITKRGHAVAKVVPIKSAGNEHLIGSMKSSIEIMGDLLTTGANWDAESRHSHRRGAVERRSKKKRTGTGSR